MQIFDDLENLGIVQSQMFKTADRNLYHWPQMCKRSSNERSLKARLFKYQFVLDMKDACQINVNINEMISCTTTDNHLKIVDISYLLYLSTYIKGNTKKSLKLQLK